MDNCVNCSILLRPNVQLHKYWVLELNPKLAVIAEEWCGHKLTNSDRLCQECVRLVVREAENRAESCESRHSSRQLGHIAVCVSCGRSLGKRSGRRRHRLHEGSVEMNYIANKIFPRQVPGEAFVCHACWLRAHKNGTSEPVRPTNITALTREPSLEDTSSVKPILWHEDNITVLTREPSLEDTSSVKPLLWQEDSDAAMAPPSRSVTKLSSDTDNSSPISEPTNITGLTREPSFEDTTPVQPLLWQEDSDAAMAPPSRSVTILSSDTNNSVDTVNPLSQSVQEIVLENYRRTADTSTHCFVPDCDNVECRRVPEFLKKSILKEEKLLITPNARVCLNHSMVFNWKMLHDSEYQSNFNATQIENMLDLLRNV